MAEENRRLTGILTLSDLSLTIRLGALDFERIEPRVVRFDLQYTGCLLESDKPVVDYTQVSDILSTELKKQYLFIEKLAADTLDILQKRWAGRWRVTVKKEHPPTDLPVKEAAVTVEN